MNFINRIPPTERISKPIFQFNSANPQKILGIILLTSRHSLPIAESAFLLLAPLV
ncbi:hypothetical protein ABP2_3096 [Bacillus subtilis subsp. subtilis]|nr:hypothetical protein [Bacillus subtilis subsp. subtilis]